MMTKTKINEQATRQFCELAKRLPEEFLPDLNSLQRTFKDQRHHSSTVQAELDLVVHERNALAAQLSAAKTTLDQQQGELKRSQQIAEQEQLRSQRLERHIQKVEAKAEAQKATCWRWYKIIFWGLSKLLAASNRAQREQLLSELCTAGMDELLPNLAVSGSDDFSIAANFRRIANEFDLSFPDVADSASHDG